MKSDIVVLVVDDEPLITKNLTTLLKSSFTCEVIERNDPFEAVEVLDKRGGELSLVIIDYLLPGMTGAELSAAIRERNLNIPIVMLSGYSSSPMVQEEAARIGVNEFVSKPFGHEDFVRTIKKLLEPHMRKDDHTALFLHHFFEQARMLLNGELPRGLSTLSYILKILKLKHFDAKRLAAMDALKEKLEEEIQYLEAMNTVNVLARRRDERLKAIQDWIGVNKELSGELPLPKENIAPPEDEKGKA